MAVRYHQIRHVISNLGVFDFETPDRTMRVRSLHPGVTIDEVAEATGFELLAPHNRARDALPDAGGGGADPERARPLGLRNREVPA